MSARSRRDDWQPGGEFPAGEAGDRLAAVLRAAAAPAHAGELAGEEAAVAAFRAAATETTAARPSRVRSVLAKVLTVKAVIAVAVAGSAGIVAATTGMLPTPWSPVPPGEQSSTSVPAPTPTERSGASPTTPDAPSIIDLCQDYADRGRAENAPKNPAFRPLIEAAGGEDKVADYCTTRTKQPPETKNDGKPEDKGKPEDTGKPEDPGKPEDAGKPEREPRNNGNAGDSSQTDKPRPPARPSTPGNPAHGAAVPPGGARPPSQGG